MTGFSLGDGSATSNCVASSNSGYGIYAGNGTTITHSASTYNATADTVSGIGIRVAKYSVVTDSTATGNSGDGISFIDGCLIARNDASKNGNGTGTGGVGVHGFGVRDRVVHCNVSFNRNDGILPIGDCTIIGNHVGGNGTNGIHISGGSANRIDDNQVRDNIATGILAGAGDVITRNTAGGNATNFTPSSGNIAPIQTPAAATNPLANIVF